MDEDCDFCNMDRVHITQVFQCLILSIQGLLHDITSKKRTVLEALTYNDRILYIIGLMVVVFAFKLIM